MPGNLKHVRFASTLTAYSPVVPVSTTKLPTPTPIHVSSSHSHSHSSASRDRGSGFTYPGRNPTRSSSYPQPQPTRRLPTTTTGTRVHTLIAYSHHPILNFDISLPPSTITTSYSSLSKGSFSEPAVYPPVSSLMLQISISPSSSHSDSDYPWSISVHASSNGHYVTVGDIFDAVYHSLRINVTPAEWNRTRTQTQTQTQTRSGGGGVESVKKAYERRYRRFRDRYAYEEEKKMGVKRVDYLRGCTRFMGISKLRNGGLGGSGLWVLNVE